MARCRSAFTLIEVMISVIVITSVVMALYVMQGNAAYAFTSYKERAELNQYLSFLIASDKYGHQRDRSHVERLVEDFALEDSIKRELRTINIELDYKLIETIDASEIDESMSQVVFEVGKSSVELGDRVVWLIRLRQP